MTALNTVPTPRPSPSLTAIGALLVSLGVLAFFAWLTTGANYAGLAADDAVYLLMSERFGSAVEHLPVHHYIASVNHFPPLLPLMLGALGLGADEISYAHWFQCLLISLSALSVAYFAYRLTRRLLPAFGIFVLFVGSPATLLLSVEIWSEFLFVALIYSGFILLDKSDSQKVAAYLASLLIGLSALTRGFGLLAVAALCFRTALSKPARLISVIFFSCLPLILSAIAGWSSSRSYYDIFAERVSNWNTFLVVVKENIPAMWRAWLFVFNRTPNLIVISLCAIVAILAAVTVVRRLRNYQVDSLFCVAYLGLLVIWPFPAVMERLLFPLVPLLLTYACVTVFKLKAQLSGGLAANAVTVILLMGGVLLVGATLQNSSKLLTNFLEPLPLNIRYLAASRNWMSIDDRSAARGRIDIAHGIISGLREARELVPAADCIYSRRPQIVMLYTKRPSYPAPTAKSAGSRPRCRFHLLINDGSLESSFRAMWPEYEVVMTEQNNDKPALILVRYRNFQSNGDAISQ
ncbi:MAG: hypothetical protein ACU84Q_07865 [Gammaproteobacteria bacterium]